MGRRNGQRRSVSLSSEEIIFIQNTSPEIEDGVEGDDLRRSSLTSEELTFLQKYERAESRLDA